MEINFKNYYVSRNSIGKLESRYGVVFFLGGAWGGYVRAVKNKKKTSLHRYYSIKEVSSIIMKKLYNNYINSDKSKNVLAQTSIIPVDTGNVEEAFLYTSSPLGSFSINGHSVQLSERKRKIVLDNRNIEPYENIIITKQPVSVDIWFRIVDGRDLKAGQYRIWRRDKANEMDEAGILDYNKDNSSKIGDSGHSPQNAARQFILDSINSSDKSSFYGLGYGSFDYDSNTYRLNSWIWCSAAAVSALLSEYKRTMNERFKDKAEKIGKCLVNKQESGGGFVVRWDYPREDGIERWKAPNDTAFIAAYGLIPLYNLTRDKDYLEAARSAAEWIIDKGIRPNGHLAAGYYEDWDFSWLYVDAGFTTSIFDKLSEIDSDIRWTKACSSFIHWYTENLRRDDGLFLKEWRANGNHLTSLFSRGQGWALDGLISAYQCTGNEVLLSTAIDVAGSLLGYQAEEGCWYYIIDEKGTGKDNKGTPVIAYNLLRLWQITGDDRYLSASWNAVSWCESRVERSGGLGYGGIKAWNREGNIVGERNATTAFLYGNSFYILAKNMLTLAD